MARKQTPAQVVIDELGGIRPAARKFAVSPSTVQRWRDRNDGRVPSEYHQDAIKHGAGRITPQDLVHGRTKARVRMPA